MTSDPATPPSRSPGSVAGGWLVRLVFLWVEVTVGIAIAYLIGEQVAPGLAARGYNVRNGEGVFIAGALGGAIALYPVIWIHRLARRLAARV